MKRSSMVRRTPLKTGVKSLQRAVQPLRRTPIAQVSAKRVKANAQRATVVSVMRLVAEGRCARCGRTNLPVAGHERLGRSQGGDIVAPDCLLCNQCNGWCEDWPRNAAWSGWKVSSKHPHDPALNVGEAWDIHGNRVIFADLSPAEAQETA